MQAITLNESEFPLDIKEKVLKDHQGFRFKKIYQLTDSDGIITYRIILSRLDKDKEVYYNTGGTLLKQRWIISPNSK